MSTTPSSDRFAPVTSGGVTVRHAEERDIDWLVGQLRNFSLAAETKRQLFEDEAYARTSLSGMVRDHLVLVAEEPGRRMGFIAGLAAPHPYNPRIMVLSEAFWWVDPAARGTRAGAMLLSQYVAWGREHCDWITMTLERSSPVRDESLTRRGFVPQERSFLMEV